MLKARAKIKDSEEVVVGSYVFGKNCHCGDSRYADKHFIMTNRMALHGIDPTTLAIETGKLDKNKKMIFGSIEVDGVMSEGGDRLIIGNDHTIGERYTVRRVDCQWQVQCASSWFSLSSPLADKIEIIDGESK